MKLNRTMIILLVVGSLFLQACSGGGGAVNPVPDCSGPAPAGLDQMNSAQRLAAVLAACQ